ncbi:MAG: ArsI/CadI family heavy metal resistance metalloenzyme [Pseudomonadota bacterium]
MNRLHLHITVEDIERSVGFYSTLLGAKPSVSKTDYAKWTLDDPAVNLAISVRSSMAPGLNHLGIEADSRDDLDAITDRLKSAAVSTFDQESTTCCYAVSDKSWVEDPSGIRWETFFTHGDSAVYGVDASQEAPVTKSVKPQPPRSACCQ